MLDQGSNNELPVIPAKRYFTIGEVSELCGVKPHVLRYWEQEFPNLKPVKRRGNRRYYQRHDVLMIAAKRDDIVPPTMAESLWKAAGQPKIVWFDCTHYGAAAFVVPTMEEVLKHFKW